MAKEINKEEFLRLVKAVYNQHHQVLTDDLNKEVLSAAQAIEADDNLDLAAVRLAARTTAEIRYFELGKTAPKELVELTNFLNQRKGKYWFWSSLTRPPGGGR